jgi:hypothetical protein
MTDLEKIQDRLRKKEAEIAALEDRLKSAKAYVQALNDVMKILNGDDARASSQAADASESALRPGSAVDQARQAILMLGEPVHISELLKMLGRDVSRESRASVASSISAYVRRGEIFARTGPNTFGLIELGHNNVDDSEESSTAPSPPPGFGLAPSGPAKPAPPPPPQIAQEVDDDIPF